ncbi:hypothetical protein ACWCQL_01480 [Streptomyces sp. NPDC002073]
MTSTTRDQDAELAADASRVDRRDIPRQRPTEADAHSASEALRVSAVRNAPAGELVSRARRLVEEASALLRQAVIAERARDVAWEEIGEAHGGISRSAAHNRYASAYKEWEAEQVTRDEDHFPKAYGQLQEAWGRVAELVDDQRRLDLLRDLTETVAAGANEKTADGSMVKIGRNYAFMSGVQGAHERLAEAPQAEQGEDSDQIAYPLHIWGKNNLINTRVFRQHWRTETDVVFAESLRNVLGYTPVVLWPGADTEHEAAPRTLEQRVADLEALTAELLDRLKEPRST